LIDGNRVIKRELEQVLNRLDMGIAAVINARKHLSDIIKEREEEED
jgi:hypothetical protein